MDDSPKIHHWVDASPRTNPRTLAEDCGAEKRRSVRTEYFFLIFLLAIFIYRGFLPGWRSLNTDFRNYYLAARLYRERSSLVRVYDPTWFQRQKDHAGIPQCLVSFVPHTLLSALPVLPLAGFTPLTAKRLWLVFNCGLLALSALLLTQTTGLGWRRTLIVTFLAIEPLAKSFLYGQMHLFVFFWLVVAFWLISRCRHFAGGICVAIAAALKIYPALFLVFFVRKKQWRALAGLVAGLVCLGGLSVWLFGWEVHRIYLGQVLPAIGRGENIDPYAPGWNSLTELLHRAFIFEPELNPHPLFRAPDLYALIQPLCQAVIFIVPVWLVSPRSAFREQEKIEWAAYLAMLIALSTGPLSYHLCVLILAAVLAVDSLLSTGRRREACVVACLYGLSCFPWMNLAARGDSGWRSLLDSPRLYPQLGLFIYLCVLHYRSSPASGRLRSSHRERYVFCFGFVLLLAIGIFAAFRHERGQFDNYSRRLPEINRSLLQGEPAVGANGLYFTRMPGTAEDFDTWRWSETGLTPFLPAEDQFHPATAPGLSSIWVEFAGPLSNIFRISDRGDANALRPQIEVVNGEQPSVSPDGRLLAFIRETHGRGALWIKALEGNATAVTGERQVVDDSYDVWEAAFEPGTQGVVFSAARRGQPEIYSVDLASHLIDRLPFPAPARYPAISPDGRWIAFSRYEHGAWHLCVADLKSHIIRRLVDGDCSSVSPAWEEDSRRLFYASDCSRGVGMTALVRVEVPR